METGTNVLSLSYYVDFRIENKKLSKYKTERGKDKFICNLLFKFLSEGFKKHNEVDVYLFTDISNASWGDKREINDIGYSCYNLVPKNETHTAFRSSGAGSELISIVNTDKFDSDKFFTTSLTVYKGNEFLVTTCGGQISANRNKR